MRIATWNINGLRARLGLLLHWLRERQPDVVGLQELKLTDQQFPHAELDQLGYRAVTHGQKAWNGVAVISRLSPVTTLQGLPGQEHFGARMLSVDVGGLSFSTVYCPNGKRVDHEEFPLKLAWFDALEAHLRRRHRPDQPLVLCGDFNICPAPLDSWNEPALAGSIFHTQEERARFHGLLDWGLVDVFREKRPDARAFSWWDYRAGAFHRDQGLRLDFLLATRPVMTRVHGVEIDREYRKSKDGLIPSDHAPVLADLDPCSR